jgi:dTDP-glucose pyrophosphorylase
MGTDAINMWDEQVAQSEETVAVGERSHLELTAVISLTI